MVIDRHLKATAPRRMPDSRGACVRVDLSAIAHNAQKLRAIFPETVHLMAVVKANGYGHGLISAAQTALDNGADYLGVALPEEGAQLRAAGIAAPCLVLGNASAPGALIAVQNGLLQTVCDEEGIKCIQRACETLDLRAQVHLKLDTGMSRIGARTLEEVEKVLRALENARCVQLTGAFTHFAQAEDEQCVRRQMARFEQLTSALPAGLMLHAAASEAALRYPWARLDMVRTGIALYGCTGEGFLPAMCWQTRVAYVKDIAPGDCVSYGGDFCADRPMRIATIAIGYGDGYLRALSGKAQVLIRGKRCPVLGRVCMDQTMVDVTHVPEAAAGDEAILMGSQQDACITAAELAEWAGTICYEALLLHADRVPVITEN